MAQVAMSEAVGLHSTNNPTNTGTNHQDDHYSYLGPFDVLCGRQASDDFPGNVTLRNLVKSYSKAYRTSAQGHKMAIAMKIVEQIHGNGGHFCERCEGGLAEISKGRAAKKVQHLFWKISRREASVFSIKQKNGQAEMSAGFEERGRVANDDDSSFDSFHV